MTQKNTASIYREMPNVQVNSPYEPQTVDHDGRPHIIVPVIMMTEGVHHGSAGPVFHPAEELSRHTGAWNGIPLVVDHPDLSASPTGSANIPQYAESAIVGRVYNTRWEDGKLKAEAWFDAQKLASVSPETLKLIESKEPIDVSVGVFTDDDVTAGDWNGEHYESISRNHRPDHLAILPHDEGACSWHDGCGVRINKKGITMEKTKDDFIKSFQANIINVPDGMNLNKDGYLSLVRAIQDKLNAMDTDMAVHFLEEVYDGSFIYRVERYQTNTPAQYFSRSYTMDESGAVEFGTDPEPVTKRVSFETVTNNKGKGENTTMSDKKPCCKEKVILLVESGAFAETDHDALSTLPESVIDGIVALADKATAPPQAAQINAAVLTPEAAIQVLKDHLKDPGQFVSLLPAEMQKPILHGMKLHAQYRGDLIDQIMTAAVDVYTKEELGAFDDGQLEKLSKAVGSKADFSIFGTGNVQTDSAGKVAPLSFPGAKTA